eukprot:11056902-Ditylum_brightwellii.AAC.1
MDEVKSVVTKEQIPHVQVKNMPVHVDGWHCCTHIVFWMLQLLKYLREDTISMKTFREDEHFEKSIGNNDIFKYCIYHDMNKFRAELRKFIVRLAFVTAASEDRKMTKKTSKEKRRQLVE